MNTRSPNSPLPYLGFGIRLRNEYLDEILQQRPKLDFIEVVIENHLAGEPAGQQAFEALSRHYPLVLHGISLAIGSPWPLDQAYLEQLKTLAERVNPVWISDHLCWKGADDLQGTLLPLPYSEDTLDHVVSRIHQVQAFLGRQILLENVPGEHNQTQEITETEFIREVAERSDSLILLDIGNLVSSSLQHGFNPAEYIEQLPAERVQQVHLPDITLQRESGDPMDRLPRIIDPIWSLYLQLIERCGPLSTLIEREDSIPTLSGMISEIEAVRNAAQRPYPGHLSDR